MKKIFIFAVSSLPLVSVLQNVALNKPARQIGTFLPTTAASNAVDGNTDGNWFHDSCSSTTNVSNVWWEVDLMGFYTIYSVEIFRRTDCCWHNLQNFEVRVSSINSTTFPTSEGQQCAYQDPVPDPGGAMLTCTRPIRGRYVIVFKPANNFLTMCEVKVYGQRLNFTGLYELTYHNMRAIMPSMSSLSAPSLLSCATECALASLCFAFNFLVISSRASVNTVTCELLHYGGFEDLIPNLDQKENWTVFFLQME